MPKLISFIFKYIKNQRRVTTCHFVIVVIVTDEKIQPGMFIAFNTATS